MVKEGTVVGTESLRSFFFLCTTLTGCVLGVLDGRQWSFAPRGLAVLYVSDSYISKTFPLVTSHGFQHGFVAEFSETGTDDPSKWGAVPAAMHFISLLGGIERVNAYQRSLLRRVVTRLLDAWNSRLLLGSLAEDVAFACVALPSDLPAWVEKYSARVLQRLLLERWGVTTFLWRDDGDPATTWIRVSCHVYNRMDDYEHLMCVCVFHLSWRSCCRVCFCISGLLYILLFHTNPPVISCALFQ
jgi:selenocysteine lyase/cysteine desulfurase